MRALTRPRNDPRTSPSGQFRTRLTTTLVALAAVAGLGLGGLAVTRDQGRAVLAAGSNPATPGAFTGYGFDQCLAPTQAKMDAWLDNSPFHAVGIYISGNSRACRSQPNLTRTWVSTQLARGWRLLPITLGPQASCQPRYPKYNDDPRINPDPTSWWSKAKAQGKLEAERAVTAAKNLGIVPRSTLFYDLEGFDLGNTNCRESALRFVHAWTLRLHELGYKSGFYSSASSGIKMVDDARVNHPGVFALPDTLWIARWDGVANTTTETRYLRSDGWTGGNRLKQYQGGHNETWGGVTINIDRNWLDVGGGSRSRTETHCGGIRVDYPSYPGFSIGTSRPEVRALKCLLVEQGMTSYGINLKSNYYGRGAANAVNAWLTREGFRPSTTWRAGHWKGLLPRGGAGWQKRGSSGASVWRLQRALIARGISVPLSGVFDRATDSAVRSYESSRGQAVNGVVTPALWNLLYRGR
ncbi:glycoside hydrolase domain-containing protein [Nocardioides sp.]|uniref:glycoside hydrolase domain-containing protein n=1 Tax=Nocardioides sp. TaxID=35761 RepID=UPI002C5ED4E0|nr:glycoside hydrolase domain-containing protein [Nocardioides sp.]HSX66550.1 glycoside hydrolase domain-containing protein [Nocardioides sp.]